jgi:hypothetical protein
MKKIKHRCATQAGRLLIIIGSDSHREGRQQRPVSGPLSSRRTMLIGRLSAREDPCHTSSTTPGYLPADKMTFDSFTLQGNRGRRASFHS